MDHRMDSVDVAVVGSGIAGAFAALEAGRAGLSVALVEAEGVFGGTAARGGGGMCLPGSPLQAERGVSDGWELALSGLAAGQGAFDLSFAEAVLRAAPELYAAVTGVNRHAKLTP